MHTLECTFTHMHVHPLTYKHKASYCLDEGRSGCPLFFLSRCLFRIPFADKAWSHYVLFGCLNPASRMPNLRVHFNSISHLPVARIFLFNLLCLSKWRLALWGKFRAHKAEWSYQLQRRIAGWTAIVDLKAWGSAPGWPAWFHDRIRSSHTKDDVCSFVS